MQMNTDLCINCINSNYMTVNKLDNWGTNTAKEFF